MIDRDSYIYVCTGPNCDVKLRWAETAAGKNAPMRICETCGGKGKGKGKDGPLFKNAAHLGDVEIDCPACKGVGEVNHFIDCVDSGRFRS
jgi:hypothetical protein